MGLQFGASFACYENYIQNIYIPLEITYDIGLANDGNSPETQLFRCNKDPLL
jgi:hypothetical protein